MSSSKKSAPKKGYVIPKFPRVMVSPARHKKLALEADKANKPIAELLEDKLKQAYGKA